MASVSYAYAVGNVRAHETGLLSQQEIEQLLGQKTPDKVMAALRDRGYGDAAVPAADGETLLRQETARLWAYLHEVTPDFALYDAFLYRHDYHNAKAVIKGILSDRPYNTLLMEPCTVAPEQLETAIRERHFDRLPEHMAAAAEKAYEALAHTADAQRCDVLLDRAAMEAMQAAAAARQIPLLTDWVNTQVFYSDAKIALRAARMQKDAAFLEAALCPCALLPLPELRRAVLAGSEEVLALLERLDVYGSREAAEHYRRSPSDFERFAENEAMRGVRRAKRITLGPEPLLGYLLGKEAELKAVHILLSGLRAGQEEAIIRERLRELYA